MRFSQPSPLEARRGPGVVCLLRAANNFPLLGVLARRVSLFVGQFSCKNNIEAFLQLDTPGAKVVCGVGPLKASLQERYLLVRCWAIRHSMNWH